MIIVKLVPVVLQCQLHEKDFFIDCCDPGTYCKGVNYETYCTDCKCKEL